MRDPSNPILFDVSRKNFDTSVLRGDDGEGVAGPYRGYVTAQDSLSNFRSYIQTFTFDGLHSPITLGEGAHSLSLGEAGAWDEASICCASAVEHDGRVLMWYAGQASGDATWRIGLAVSMDGGVSFTRYGTTPVLLEGARDDFDGRGVSDPEVLWDAARAMYRMWYTAAGALGTSSIGYAVSTDGVAWHKFPGNPVVTQGSVGLDTMGSAAVVRDDNGWHMWLQATQNERVGLGIFALTNDGVPSKQP
jgi:hypothetical protein